MVLMEVTVARDAKATVNVEAIRVIVKFNKGAKIYFAKDHFLQTTESYDELRARIASRLEEDG
jgi:hypothetical protein